MILTLIIFVLILSFLIIIHELGHFTAAKKAGLLVHEFGLGLPPKIWGKKYGETEYTLNALPIGGFVKIEGEDPSESVTGSKSRNFQFQKPKVKLIILLAGIIMNFAFAIFLYYTFFIFNNFISNPLVAFTDYNFRGANKLWVTTLISGVSNKSLEGRLRPGDVIFNVEDNTTKSKLNGFDTTVKALSKKDQIKTVTSVTFDNFENFVNSFTGPATLYLYNIQDGSVRTEVVQVSYSDKLDKNIVGIYLGKMVYLDYSVTPLTKLFSGFTHSANMIGYSLKSFGALIGLSVKTRDVSVVSTGVSGPVGIYSVIKSVLISNNPQTFWIILDLTALISLSLGFMNLLPIPALDGGRAVFVLYEWVRGKPVKPSLEANIHKFGMLFLLALLFLITIKDVVNLF